MGKDHGGSSAGVSPSSAATDGRWAVSAACGVKGEGKGEGGRGVLGSQKVLGSRSRAWGSETWVPGSWQGDRTTILQKVTVANTKLGSRTILF